MTKLLCGLTLSLTLLSVAACSTLNEAIGTSISAGAPASQEDADLLVYQTYFSPAAIINCIAQVRATPERRSCRDLIAYARMRYIDINYEKFRRRAFLDVNGGNAATDLTVLGLNAAGTLVPAASTKAILAAISGGLVGAKGVIDKDVLYNAGIQTLILKMDADRAAVRLRITNSLKQNEEVYPFEAAELDAGDYYRVGTLTNALITLQGDAGFTLSNDISQINQGPAAPLPSPPAAVAFSNAARAAAASPPMAAAAIPAAPAGPAAPAVPATPAAPIPALPAAPVATLPVPAPPPASPVSGLSMSATTPAKSRLFVALGSDPQGQHSYDRARVVLLRQCFAALGVPPATLVSDFLNAAKFAPQIGPAADCITAKLAAGGR